MPVHPALLPVGKVTMLFTDIEGSTKLLDCLGDRYPEVLAQHHRLVRDAITASGGYEVDTAGDSFFVVFGRAHDAVECARRAQRALAAERWPGDALLRVRMGIHTGTPAVHGDEYVGMDVHRAARVMSIAHGGQILLTAQVRDALASSTDLRDLGHHRLKDLPAPEHLFQLLVGDLLRDFPPLASLNRSNLPLSAHPLVGRRVEVARALDLIARDDVRLVTLVGPGGTGKTRLGVEVAAEAVTRYRDGVWFVPLGAIRDPELVPSEIARAVGVEEASGVPPMGTLVSALASRQLLLLLDNFEHLTAATAVVGQLLEAAPHVDVMITSREALRLRGEHRLDVPPLPLADSVELFIDRARAVRADAVQDEPDRAAVKRLCARLEGLPLSLELAAARTALFGVRALETRMAKRLALAEGHRDLPERQRTLRATIDWSYELLSSEEQHVFRGLAPFIGGARLEAIESMFAGAPLDPTDAAAALLDKSMLRRRDDPDGHPRLWMLETIREYSAERAATEGEALTAAARHAEHFLEFAEEGDRHINTRAQRDWIERLEAEHDNLRAAFEHLMAHAPADALRLAAALGWFWEIHGHLFEGRERLRRALAVASARGATAAKAAFLAGRLSSLQGDTASAELLLGQAIDLAGETGDTRIEVLALTNLAVLLPTSADRINLHNAAITRARAADDHWALRGALNNLGDELRTMGDIEAARPPLQHALELSRRVGEPRAIALSASNLADVALSAGDFEQAQRLVEEALENSRAIDYRALTGSTLAIGALLAIQRGDLDIAEARIAEGVDCLLVVYDIEAGGMLLSAAAALAAARGSFLRAASLWAGADRQFRQLGVDDLPGPKRLREQWLPKAQTASDRHAWEAAWSAGAQLSTDQGLELARQSIRKG